LKKQEKIGINDIPLLCFVYTHITMLPVVISFDGVRAHFRGMAYATATGRTSF
jgi:hypothetical protein